MKNGFKVSRMIRLDEDKKPKNDMYITPKEFNIEALNQYGWKFGIINFIKDKKFKIYGIRQNNWVDSKDDMYEAYDLQIKLDNSGSLEIFSTMCFKNYVLTIE